MLFYKEKILTSSQLRKLAEHKYSVESSSLIEPYLQVKTNKKRHKTMTFDSQLSLKVANVTSSVYNYIRSRSVAVLELAGRKTSAVARTKSHHNHRLAREYFNSAHSDVL